MKTTLCLILLGVGVSAMSWAQCFKHGVEFAQFDFDQDGEFEISAEIQSIRQIFPGDPLEYFGIRSWLFVRQNGSVLRATDSRIDFLPGENISNSSLVYQSAQSLPGLILIEYTCSDLFPAVEHSGEFRSATSALVGAKSTNPDTGDVTLGWFQFNRPSVEPGNAFMLESWAYHPIPNEPIRAGEPPDLPEPAFTWSEEGVTVSWPEKAWMLRLEMATSLTPPVPWQPVDTGGLTSVTLPPPEGGTELYFRLVAPEL